MIETNRLYIRKPLLLDLDAIYAINNSDFVLKYNATNKMNKEAFEKQYINRLNEDIWHLVLKTDNTVIGSIAIEEDCLRYRVNSCCISYSLDENYAKQGYMKEAMHAVLIYLFTERNFDIVTARVFVPNLASANLLKSCGFVQEGCLRQAVRGYQDIIYDDLLFSLLKADFINKTKGVK